MRATALKPMLRVRMLFARMHQIIGWQGVAGLGLSAVAVTIVGLGSKSHQFLLPENHSSVAEAVDPVEPIDGGARTHKGPEIAGPGEVPLLLTQIQQAAVTNGLGWLAADYRISPATENEPASLEVRCSLKGPYPDVRRMVTLVLGTVPALSLRELSLSRPNSEGADVDAKLVLAVFLQDEPATDSASSRDAAR